MGSQQWSLLLHQGRCGRHDPILQASLSCHRVHQGHGYLLQPLPCQLPSLSVQPYHLDLPQYSNALQIGFSCQKSGSYSGQCGVHQQEHYLPESRWWGQRGTHRGWAPRNSRSTCAASAWDWCYSHSLCTALGRGHRIDHWEQNDSNSTMLELEQRFPTLRSEAAPTWPCSARSTPLSALALWFWMTHGRIEWRRWAQALYAYAASTWGSANITSQWQCLAHADACDHETAPICNRSHHGTVCSAGARGTSQLVPSSPP